MAEVDVTCIGRVVEFVVALYITILPPRSPSALPLPSPPTLRFTLPLTAPPHTKGQGRGD